MSGSGDIMKAAVCRAFKAPMTIESIEIAAPGRGQVAVDISACAICHSDISYVDGIWGGNLPLVLGHEAAGTVTAAGPGARFSPGDRVLVTLIRACEACPACARQQPTSCDEAWNATPSPLSQHGKMIGQGMSTAAFAEKVVVHQSQVAKLSGDIAFDTASLLACGVITGVGAVKNTAQMEPGATVAVIGAGGVGLNTIQGAALLGASKVIAVDLAPEKLEAAYDFGATDALLSGGDTAQQIKKLTGGRGADYVFVAAGIAPLYTAATEYLAPGGAIVMVGMPPSGAMAEYEPANLAAMNQRLLGSRMGQTVLDRDIPRLIGLYQEGRLKLDELISGRYALEEINAAIADTRTGISRRNVICFE